MSCGTPIGGLPPAPEPATAPPAPTLSTAAPEIAIYAVAVVTGVVVLFALGQLGNVLGWLSPTKPFRLVRAVGLLVLSR
jgi:hypothetical protein